MKTSEIEAIAAVLQTARHEIGVREIGSSNTGKRVRQYQAATTLGGTGWPWCAAFIAWVLEYALGKELAKLVWLPTASCDFILDFARRNRILHTKPRAGCVGLVMASANDATHTFFVEDVDGKKLTTIEGNTNDGGSREGNGVYRRPRTDSPKYLYVYWMDLLPIADTYALFSSDGRKLDDLRVIDGTSYVAGYKWAAWLDETLGWDSLEQSVYLNGKRILAQPKIIDGRAFIPIRTAALNSGISLDVDVEKRTIRLVRD